MRTLTFTDPAARVRPRPTAQLWFARALAAAVGTALLAGTAVAAQADDLDDRRAAAVARQNALEAKNEDLKSELEDTSANLSKVYLELKGIEAKIPVAQADLDVANGKVESTLRAQQLLAQRLADAKAQEKALEGQVAKGATQVVQAHDDVAAMARRAMRGDGAITSLGVVTGAQSTQQFVDDYALAKTVSRTQSRELRSLQDTEALAKNRSVRLEAVRQQVADLKAQADEKVKEAKAAQEAAAQRKAALEDLQAQQKTKAAAVEKEKKSAQASLDQNEQDTATAQQQVATIAAQIKHRNAVRAAAEKKRQEEAAKKRAAERKKHGSSSGGGSSGGGGSSSGGGSSGGSSNVAAGRLAWPVDNTYVTSSYGMRLHPILHVWRLHSGVDLHAPCGVPIKAAASGTVVYAGWLGGYGNRVIVDNGAYGSRELFTTYNHMVNFVVRDGQHVSQGQVVGHAGTYGLSTGCHLHFEVMLDGSFTNPMPFLP